MVKSVLGVNHPGFRDWLGQRLSAIILTVGCLSLLFYLMVNPDLTYRDWRNLFGLMSVRVFSLLFYLSLAFHSWVGIWTVVTDYVKPPVLRLMVHLLVFFTLLIGFLWLLMMMWSF